jgi:hypothetical protein
VIVPEIITGSAAELVEHLLDREERGLGVQRVEDRLDQDQVDAALEQRAGRSGRPPPARRR